MQIFIRLGGSSRLQHQPLDFLGMQPNLVHVKLTNFSDTFREIIRLIGENTSDRSEIGRPLSNDSPRCPRSAWMSCVRWRTEHW